MEKKVTADLLKRYAVGKCTTDEIRLIENWLDDEKAFSQENLPENEDPVVREQIWAAVAPGSRRRPFGMIWRVAAAAALILGIFFTVYKTQVAKEKQVAISKKTITAPKGSIKVVRLPDSSLIWLQGGASVSFSQPFGKTTRNVTLERGKAQFDVSHNRSKPFVVQCGQSRVEVLGTRFIVNQDSRSTQVTLTRGKIRFHDDKHRTQILYPGQQLNFNNMSAEIQLTRVDTSYVSAWVRQSLWFKNTPLSQVMREINEVYGVSCKTGPKVDSNRLLNGQFDQMALTDVLRLLENSTGYRFRQQNNIVRVD